jgi:iron transport multicopper oxidase
VSPSGIPPGQSFDYVIPINSSGQWGTYWVHAHASVCNLSPFLNPTAWLNNNNTEQGQYVDGLRAPLVIHPSNEVHSYDAEYTVILGDWYHNEHSTLLQRFISISNPSGGEPVPGQPDKLLIVVGLSSSILFAHRQTQH